MTPSYRISEPYNNTNLLCTYSKFYVQKKPFYSVIVSIRGIDLLSNLNVRILSPRILILKDVKNILKSITIAIPTIFNLPEYKILNTT